MLIKHRQLSPKSLQKKIAVLSDGPHAARRVTPLGKHNVCAEGMRRLSVRAAAPVP